MALIDITTLANSPTFRNRVKGAMVTTAISVVGEALTPGKETLLDKRHSLGVEILNSTDGKVNSFALSVAANPTVLAAGEAATDGDIEFTVVSVYNDIAGVKNSEL